MIALYHVSPVPYHEFVLSTMSYILFELVELQENQLFLNLEATTKVNDHNNM